MNKKNKTYFLVIAVVAVWGTIGYKFYSNMNPAIPKVQIVGASSFDRIEAAKGEKTKIQPDYRDPFLGKLYKKPIKKSPPRVKVKKEPIIFPPIQFIGIIEGSTTSFILEINGKQEIFKLGDTIQGIALKKAKNKSIIILYKKASKEIVLKE